MAVVVVSMVVCEGVFLVNISDQRPWNGGCGQSCIVAIADL